MRDLRVTLLQPDPAWNNIARNIEKLTSFIAETDASDLIVLPEMFSTGFAMDPQGVAEGMDGKAVAWMKKMAKERTAVLCGSLMITEDGSYFNRFVAAFPDGSLITYDKRHLFTLSGEDRAYTSGKRRALFEINGWKILPQVCYDLRFPVLSRSRQSRDKPWEYDLIVYVANWPKPRVFAWDTLLKARAIENQAYCIGVNRVGEDQNGYEFVGHSAAYDYAGHDVCFLDEEERAKTVVLEKGPMEHFRQSYPFQKDSDEFELLL